MSEVRAGRSEFAGKERRNVSRDGKTEVGVKGWFATNEGWWGYGKGVIHLQLRILCRGKTTSLEE